MVRKKENLYINQNTLEPKIEAESEYPSLFDHRHVEISSYVMRSPRGDDGTPIAARINELQL